MGAHLPARSLAPELMDDPALDAIEHERALRGLDRTNRWCATADSIWRPIENLARARGLTLGPAVWALLRQPLGDC